MVNNIFNKIIRIRTITKTSILLIDQLFTFKFTKYLLNSYYYSYNINRNKSNCTIDSTPYTCTCTIYCINMLDSDWYIVRSLMTVMTLDVSLECPIHVNLVEITTSRNMTLPSYSLDMVLF